MEKILIEVEGTIHTFESIKEAAKYKLEFLEKTVSKRGARKHGGSFYFPALKENFINDPNESYWMIVGGGSIKEIEEYLMALCMVGIDIDEYFVCEKQNKQKRGFCGRAPYKRICEMLKEDANDFSPENDINEDMLDEFLFSDSLYFCSSTKKGT